MWGLVVWIRENCRCILQTSSCFRLCKGVSNKLGLWRAKLRQVWACQALILLFFLDQVCLVWFERFGLICLCLVGIIWKDRRPLNCNQAPYYVTNALFRVTLLSWSNPDTRYAQELDNTRLTRLFLTKMRSPVRAPSSNSQFRGYFWPKWSRPSGPFI